MLSLKGKWEKSSLWISLQGKNFTTWIFEGNGLRPWTAWAIPEKLG